MMAMLRSLVLCLTLFGCGGGGGSGGAPAAVVSTPPAIFHYADFVPYRRGGFGEFGGGRWEIHPHPGDMADVLWGQVDTMDVADIEEHGIAVNPADGNVYVWLNAFVQQGFEVDDSKRIVLNDPGDIARRAFLAGRTGSLAKASRLQPIFVDGHKLIFRYAIFADRAEILDGPAWRTITPPAGMIGHPYAIEAASGPYTVRIWGRVLDDPQKCVLYNLPQSACSNETIFFWQHTITPPEFVQDDCWQTDALRNRSAIRQQEVWWQRQGIAQGWTVGAGDVDATGLPTGANVRYGRAQTMASGAGFDWTFQNFPDAAGAGAWSSCLIRGMLN